MHNDFIVILNVVQYHVYGFIDKRYVDTRAKFHRYLYNITLRHWFSILFSVPGS